MMYSEERKLHLIEEVLKISNDAVLIELEDFLARSKKKAASDTNGFKEFSGIWSAEEAAEIENAIAESCEQINPNDWK